MMAEAGLSSDQVTGTGKDGRVMKEDVQKAVGSRRGPRHGRCRSAELRPPPSQMPCGPVTGR